HGVRIVDRVLERQGLVAPVADDQRDAPLRRRREIDERRRRRRGEGGAPEAGEEQACGLEPVKPTPAHCIPYSRFGIAVMMSTVSTAWLAASFCRTVSICSGDT